ncbi:uncharacterized protein DS421_4g126410 [Arachis hypogaea]|nr:uncharacterized protein DS421_4g126410 [Arachis hypogaea]
MLIFCNMCLIVIHHFKSATCYFVSIFFTIKVVEIGSFLIKIASTSSSVDRPKICFTFSLIRWCKVIITSLVVISTTSTSETSSASTLKIKTMTSSFLCTA